MVTDFHKVLLNDLPGVLPIERLILVLILFWILIIFLFPHIEYDLDDLNELKKDLKDLLDKDSICRSVSSWGTTILFV